MTSLLEPGGTRIPSSFLVNPRDFKWLRKRFLSMASRVEMVMIFLFPIILSTDAVSLTPDNNLAIRRIKELIARGVPSSNVRPPSVLWCQDISMREVFPLFCCRPLVAAATAFLTVTLA